MSHSTRLSVRSSLPIRLAVTMVMLIVAVGCEPRKKGNKKTRQKETPGLPWTPAAIAHGGVGSPPSRTDGVRAAVDAALAVLEAGGDELDAAVAGVVVMENDARFNAGTGSRVRIDGETVQMDASVMRSSGAFGAVAVIEHVQNPIQVARAVIDTPHLLIAGDGATRFARTLGMPEYDPATDEMRAATRLLQEKLRKQDPSLPKRWADFDWRKHWNFEKTLAEAGFDKTELGTDTVGVAVRGADGKFAVAASTGGTAITLRGRVGDVPVFGAGLYSGPHGAVASTGTGERIIETRISRWVHGQLKRGRSASDVAEAAVKKVRKYSDNQAAIGVIVVAPKQMAAAADRPMAWAARQLGSTVWAGPVGP